MSEIGTFRAPSERQYFSRVVVPRALLGFFIVATLIILQFPAGAWVSNMTHHFSPIHTLLELLGILASFSAFTVGYATYQNVRSSDILILSMTCFVVAWLDLGHTLSFTGMPDFVTPSGPDKAIDFWLVSRMTGAIAFLFISVSPPRPAHLRTRPWLMVGSVAWVLLWFYLILLRPELLPTMYTPAHGLTPLKIALEWCVLIFSVLGGISFYRQSLRNGLISFEWMACASFIFAMTSLFFTRYRDFDDLYNFTGHVYKAVAFLLLYRAIFVECIARPYEEARRAEMEASRANISKSRFLANVSHELRTPLGVISGFSELLVKLEGLPDEGKRWSAMILRNSYQLRGLIDDLLDLSKAENEKISVQAEDFNVLDTVEEAMSGLRLQTEGKGVKLILDAQLPTAFAFRSDRMRFRQIFLNVLGNAVKFTAQGQIEVTLSARPAPPGKLRYLEVSVKDTGIGISPEDAQRLFQPFAQADDPTRRRFSGTGLGLALSKRISTLLGGDLRLTWSHPGRGSQFVFTLDNLASAQTSRPLPASDIARPPAVFRFADRRILAAEDSEDNQDLLEVYLRPTRAQVTFVANGAEAVTLAKYETFDLILMDIQMPIMDGFEAVTQLRNQGWRGPILALTAHAHAPERERALKGGFDGYLIKPLSRDLLLQAMQNAFAERPRSL